MEPGRTGPDRTGQDRPVTSTGSISGRGIASDGVNVSLHFLSVGLVCYFAVLNIEKDLNSDKLQ